MNQMVNNKNKNKSNKKNNSCNSLVFGLWPQTNMFLKWGHSSSNRLIERQGTTCTKLPYFFNFCIRAHFVSIEFFPFPLSLSLTHTHTHTHPL